MIDSKNQLRRTKRTLLAIVASLSLLPALNGCGEGAPVRFFTSEAYPERLSEWGVVTLNGDRLVLGQGVEPYDLNTSLFTDYAQKLRTLYLPPGTSATYHESAAFQFPVGTIISKTFYYPKGAAPGLVKAVSEPPIQQPLDRRRIEIVETRLLVRQADGWDALPYVWQGDDAVLMIAGTLKKLSIELPDGTIGPLPYIVPTRNECAACHATDHSSGALEPIGPKARHLNRGYQGEPVNQLAAMSASGRLQGLPDPAAIPKNATSHGDASIAEKARAYLDVNCGHCHSPTGAADTSGLFLDSNTLSTRALGICKPPIAAGQGTGGRSYSIVPGAPDDSILVFRMATDDPGSRMPELGRSLVHTEGVALVADWIEELEGECIERPGTSLTGD
jgi:uncharacterized repeat protein (TIGR03806 family)